MDAECSCSQLKFKLVSVHFNDAVCPDRIRCDTPWRREAGLGDLWGDLVRDICACLRSV